ncbi:MAG: LrgB family protein [Treponema sp.]|jgi:putative effector of murein hydrolase|nr:LrgB family protein [Treponema sp.]
MNEILSMPLSGILVSIGAYLVGLQIRRLIPHPLANPLVIANVLIILTVIFTPLSPEQYMAGAGFISLFIVPATATLGLKIYRQWANFKANMIPVLGGCAAGSVVSVASLWGLCRLFGIDGTISLSLFPKSVTTAIAMELSAKYGGLVGVTIPAVIITGVFSAFASPFFIKALKLKDPVAAGVAMGVSGHAICTSVALELGETQGAMSGIAIGVAGLFTSVIFLLFF